MTKLMMMLVFLLTSVAQGQTITDSKKNVLVIMTDDLSQELFNDLLRNGLIPNIKNNIVDRGLTFPNAFVTNPVCCPSRATYLTGQYSMNNGVLDVATGILYWLDKKSNSYGGESNTIATWMQQAGYRTGHIGKYLNGYGMNTQSILGTLLHVPPGYDTWYGLMDPSTYNTYNYVMIERDTPTAKTQAVFYPKTFNTLLNQTSDFMNELFKKSNDVYLSRKPEKYKNSPDEIIRENYQTDLIAEKTLLFFDNHDKAKPFFLSVMPMAPHIELRPEDIEFAKRLGYKSHFREIIYPAPRHEKLVSLLPSPMERLMKKESFNEMDISDKPNYFKDKASLDEADLQAIENQYRHMMASMLAVDDLVGKIVTRLKSENLFDDTIIIFTADNGYMYGEHRLSSKAFAYDESAKVPLIVAGGAEQGKTSQAIILNTDLAPTIASIANIKPGLQVDGRSFARLLDNRNDEWRRKQFFIEHYLDREALAYINDIPVIGQWFVKNAAERSNLEGYFIMMNIPSNDYKAIRRITDVEEHLYVEYYNKKLQRPFEDKNLKKATTPEQIEFYDLMRDPFQVRNLAPLDNRNRKKWSKGADGKRYGDLIDQFVKCSGDSCRELEDL